MTEWILVMFLFFVMFSPLKPPELLFLLQVMPYSTGCKTALSNFEAALDYRVGYFLPCTS
jgi:hypothetical protein